MPRRFLRLLARPHIAGLAWWSVVSRLPVYLMSLAMVLVVREQGGGYPQAGLVSALYTVGMALGSPLVARRVDRVGRRTVLLATGVTYPAALILLVWATGPADPAQLVLAVLAGASLPPANACMRGLWARLPLAGDVRATAYLWEALLTELLVIGTPVMLAALMTTGSAASALTAVAVLGGVGAVGLALTPLPPEVTAQDRAAAEQGGSPGGLLGPLRNRALLALLAVMAASAVPIGLMTLAIPAFVDAHGSAGRTGFVYACWGIGSAVGALWLGDTQTERPVHRRFPWLVLAFAAGTAVPLLATSEITLGLALAVGGAPIALVSAAEMTLVGSLADERLLTEAFTWASLSTVLGEAIGQQTGGLLTGPLGPHGVFAVAVGTALLAAVGAFACRGLFARTTAVPAIADTAGTG
ncbi:MFS transporter [Streptomyces sp. NPDC020362]|uniref:MFS transporter n=1 Tax=unclassified Streptomyces TaxID=2593676 RepID=UPI0033E13E75